MQSRFPIRSLDWWKNRCQPGGDSGTLLVGLQRIFLFLWIAGFLPVSCATFLSPERVPFFVETDPPGATIQVYSGRVDEKNQDLLATEAGDRTPATIYLDSSSAILLRLEKPGYRTKTLRIHRNMDPAASGFLFLPVDILSGSFMEPDDAYLSFDLEEEEGLTLSPGR